MHHQLRRGHHQERIPDRCRGAEIFSLEERVDPFAQLSMGLPMGTRIEMLLRARAPLLCRGM